MKAPKGSFSESSSKASKAETSHIIEGVVAAAEAEEEDPTAKYASSAIMLRIGILNMNR